MKNITFLFLILGSTYASSSPVKTANAVLDAAKEIRARHAATDQQSLIDYDQLGSVKVQEISKEESYTKLKMSYQGPADICDYQLTVKTSEYGNIVTFDKVECAE